MKDSGAVTKTKAETDAKDAVQTFLFFFPFNFALFSLFFFFKLH